MTAALGSRPRAADWLRRYGVAELVGTCAALLAAWLAETLGAPLVAIAFAAAAGENVGFYGVILGREVAADSRTARATGGRYGARQLWRTVRELLVEFGPAELLDSLLVRPLAMGLGARWLGRDVGVIAGKVVADATFYLPVILTYEARRRWRTRHVSAP